MKETDIAWLAGLLEGEGSFIVQKVRAPYISVQMTDKDIIQRVADMWNRKVVMGGKGGRLGNKDQYKTALHGPKTVYEVCKMILPHMGDRRTTNIKKILNVLERRFIAEANFLQKIVLIRELYGTGKFTQKQLGKMAGHSERTIRHRIKSGAPSIIQFRGWNWSF